MYFNASIDGDNRLVSLVDVVGLKGLPVTTIVAEIDPLQTEGQLLRDKLTLAGMSIDYTLYAGTTHEFFGAYAVVSPANNTQGRCIISLLKSGETARTLVGPAPLGPSRSENTRPCQGR